MLGIKKTVKKGKPQGDMLVVTVTGLEKLCLEGLREHILYCFKVVWLDDGHPHKIALLL